MKLLFSLFLSAVPASAQIYADVSTTLGDFSIELYHEDSPKAVANLMTLAEGTRPWIDSTTRRVRHNTPYYDGIIFHRVIKDFMNQAGSPNGMGTDGPGYNYPDEVDNGLVHDEPYLLSAANSGPHTNGSQFFTTVVPTPHLDGIHTVYGKVVTGTETIDLINNTEVIDNTSTPVTPVEINSMRIRRVGAEAMAFDEFAQGLPTVTAPEVEVVAPTESDPAKLLINQPAGTTLRVASSLDLESWLNVNRYLDVASAPLEEYSSEMIQKKEFFLPALVEWPSEAIFPTNLLGQTISIPNTIGTFTLTLTDPGTILLTQAAGADIEGEIDYDNSTFEHDGYGTSMVIYSDGLVPVRFRLGADLPMTAPPAGRVTGTAFTTSPISFSGTFTVAP